MTEYERSRTLHAPPEQVFDRAADVRALDAWLPRDLHVRPEEPPAVTVHEDREDRDERALLRSERDQLRMEWGTRDEDRYAGWLQVAGIDDDTSSVTVHLSFFDEEHAPPPEQVDRAMEDSLDRLARQVQSG
ncbi:uncharacterized protein YndB with AHSA1/START domain [Thermocatellispora tengchongensis]|uniref:Uncharacterized protein YndB with AHSA1/START domain n=1 Tax=Thermocatellispora tengchongensis TaxID=1073253 RepID=A0A840P2S5_9ACTN|nr:SRPBCC family protein [Thermocatellispora tengchongensis]MBB5132181.1 uncharacterized protein YndB with AHSA1/START domain [Thermocatellispora tengchongensis]